VSLYTDLIEAGIKVSNHESDLYCPVNEQTRELLKKHNLKGSMFKNRVEGGYWFDVPFQFDPFWEKRAA
jgi:hypothetical protein